MPLRSYEESVATTSRTRFRERVREAEPSLAGAAFRLENDVVAAVDWATREVYEPEEDFDMPAAAKASRAYGIKPDAFVGVQSRGEWAAKEAQVEREFADRLRMARGGWGGVGLGILAGVLSPTIAIPAGGPVVGAGARGARGALKTGTWVGAGAALQEGILYASQELRTPAEVGLGIGSAVVLGGLLGGASAMLSKQEFDTLAAGMVDGTDPPTILAEVGPSSVGAAANTSARYPFEEGAGQLEAAPGVQTLKGLSPVLRMVQQPYSKTLTWAAAQLDTTGLAFQGNVKGVATAQGGDILSRYRVQYGKLYRAEKQVDEIIKQHQGVTTAAAATLDKFVKVRKSGSLSYKEFQVEIGKALARGGEHDLPEVAQAAKIWREEFFLPFLKEGKEVNLRGFEDIGDEAAAAYLPRIVRKQLAQAQYEDLVQILKENSLEKLNESFSKRVARVEEQVAREKQTAEDISLSAEDAASVRAGLEKEIRGLPDQFPGATGDIAAEIRALRAAARATDDKAEKKALSEQVKQLEEANKEALKPFKIAEGKLRRRFKNLDETRAGLEERQQRVLDRINSLEGQQLATLERVVNSAQKLLARMDKLSDEAIEAELEKIQKQLDQASAVFERGEAKIAELDDTARAVFGDEGFRPREELVDSDLTPTERISQLRASQETRLGRVEALKQKIDDAIENKVDAREAVQETLEASLRRVQGINNKRAIRLQKLQERAAALDPANVPKRVAEIEARIAARIEDFLAKEDRPDVTLDGFKADFTALAEKNAREVAGKLVGDSSRAPAVSLLVERGPELARTLDIDPTRVWSNGRAYEEFLEHDIDIVARRYVKTMAADIEVQRTFGSVNPLAKTDGQYEVPAMRKIAEEFTEARKEAAKITDQKKREREMEKISAQEAAMVRDFSGVLDRIRHIRGIPDDPSAWGYRAGRIAMNLNVLRLMGNVVISSVPDMARPIMKYGLLNTFRDGFIPLVSNMKAFKMTAEEAKNAGGALDLMLHGRASAIFDLMDEYSPGTKFERSLQYATNKMGTVAMFDFWNTGMKQFTASIANAEMMRSLRLIMGETKGSKKKLDQANRFLARHGIDSANARLIWRELRETPGGSNDVNGVLLPNTERWRSEDAKRAYRAALVRNLDDTIVTPGAGERPLWVDKSMGLRLIAQFRSFTLSSTTKVMLAASQDMKAGHAAQVLSGMSFSLALGALSYYTWAVSRGGKSQKEMENASLEKWADEAITRSGLLAVFGELHKVAERTPGLVDYVTMSGRTTSRSPFNQPLVEAFGPTAGLIKNLERIMLTADEPSAETFGQGRQMLPYQNLWWLRRQVDKVEDFTKRQAGVAP